jgi:hypothetical protein
MKKRMHRYRFTPQLILMLVIFPGRVLYSQASYPRGTALFDGIYSFQYDSLFRSLIKTKGVSSVTERVSRKTGILISGTLYFDREAHVIETTVYRRNKFEYKGDLLVNHVHYNERDTTKVVGSTSYTYNDNARLLLTEQTYERDGKMMTMKESETKILLDTPKKRYAETKRFYDNKIAETKYTLDSTAGIYNFVIIYQYDPKDLDAKGRKQGKKVTERSYMKDNCKYVDKVTYKVNGRLEVADKFETTYYQLDTNGKLIEYGELEYEKAVEEYYRAHPQEFNYYSYSPNLLKALFEGKLPTTKKAKIKQVFDEKSRLVEKTHYGKKYRFVYNSSNQLTEQIQGTTREQIFYDKNGVIIKVTTTGLKQNGGNVPEVVQEVDYIYTYF